VAFDGARVALDFVLGKRVLFAEFGAVIEMETVDAFGDITLEA